VGGDEKLLPAAMPTRKQLNIPLSAAEQLNLRVALASSSKTISKNKIVRKRIG
jgi:hypothetical protein